MRADNLRPTRLQDYIGQDQIKEPLAAAMTSAKRRKVALGHVLLSGPPGLGKTTLASIIANEMGWKFRDVLGSTAGNPYALAKTFIGMEPKTVFFIDEIHALRKPVQEVLYPVLEDARVLYRSGRTQGEFSLEDLTVIGATTDLGKLAQPFIDRFQLPFELLFYEEDELMEIGDHSSRSLKIPLPEEALEVIAERSRGTPRYVNRFVKWVRDFQIYEEIKDADRQYVEYVLWKKLRVDCLGLRPLDRNYLRVLAEADKPVGIEAIASRLRQAEVTLTNTVEPYLMYRDLVQRIRSGRAITEAGRAHLASIRRKRK